VKHFKPGDLCVVALFPYGKFLITVDFVFEYLVMFLRKKKNGRCVLVDMHGRVFNEYVSYLRPLEEIAIKSAKDER
jgi:hypothetical protein